MINVESKHMLIRMQYILDLVGKLQCVLSAHHTLGYAQIERAPNLFAAAPVVAGTLWAVGPRSMQGHANCKAKS